MNIKIKNLYQSHKSFYTYFLISVFVTILDIIVSRVSENIVDPVLANTFGVVVGFVVQYFLCTKKVYNNSNIRTLVIFFLTWLLGLGLADIIIWIVRVKIFNNENTTLIFLIAKFFSIAIPFFITYFLRKKLIIGENVNE